MLKQMNKISAGTFLIPLIISMILFTFWPNLFAIGGFTEAMFSDNGVGFISGMLAFATGSRINIQSLKRLLKHQGVLLLVKVVIAIVASIIYLTLFGNQGIWGISGVAFVVAMFSINPALQLSILENYGYEEDAMIMGLSTAVTLPMLPMIFYSIFYSSSGLSGINWTPILSALIPLIIGFVLGNLDPDIGKLYSPIVGALLPFLGWNLGQSMNIIAAVKAGASGMVLTLIFIAVMSLLYIVDKKLLQSDGVSALAMMSVAGVSTIAAPAIAEIFPEVANDVMTANSQILFASIITSIIMPIFIGNKYKE